jgi:hypothetical protein
MDKRPESRIEAEIPVRVWGMDSEGRPFIQFTVAKNMSSDGALLMGINHPLKPHDIIGVQYAEKKARFRVVWVIDAGARKIELGIQLMAGQDSPWHELTPAETIAETGGKNKRKFARHKVSFPIDIGLLDKGRTHLSTTSTDIGGRGCYVETRSPLTRGTKVSISFMLGTEEIQTSGVVRASDPGVGMGIEFTDLENTVQHQLQQYVETMDDQTAAAPKGKATARS